MSEPRDLIQNSAADARSPTADGAYLDRLNAAQREAVEAVDGPVLVLAGAGTGKTRVLITRVAHLLVDGHAWPNQILAVTFTNRAARQMVDRVSALIGRAAEGVWIGTFHSLCVRILRSHAELIGLKPNFTILDSDDQIRLLKQVLDAANIDTKKWPPRALSIIIQRWKDRGLTPDKVPADAVDDFAFGRGVDFYRAYQDRLKTLNAADFGDLILHCLNLFTGHPDVLADYQRRFKYLMVDEYQDTNVAQYLWLRLLAQERQNICCVGDDDQSIYGWRGADVRNILRFEKDFPGARVIRLEQNYRSSRHILGAASGVIAHNEGRLGKTLWTERGGEKVKVRSVWDGEAEARWVGEEIEALQHREHRLGEIAVLVRAGFQTREFEERMITLGVPYRVVGGPRFYERMEIRDAIAYFRVIVQPDDGLAFERIVNLPRRGIGASTMRVIHQYARASEISLTEAAIRLIETDELPMRARRPLAALFANFDRWRGQLGLLPHSELAEIVLDESGYTGMWQNDRSPEAPGRLENLKELVAALAEFESLPGFLEHVSLVMENQENADGERVSLMTLHSAKGLEFDTVFLPGWEEGLFPHQRALDESGQSGLEEERRLAHVGLTRARHRIFITAAANRRVYNMWQNNLPSRFIDELPAEHVEQASELGFYGEDANHGRAARGRAGAGGRQGGGNGGSGKGGRRFGPSPGDSVIDGKARVVASDSGGKYKVGKRVFHQKFGYGRIHAVEGEKLRIDFEKAGVKMVVDRFVEPV